MKKIYFSNRFLRMAPPELIPPMLVRQNGSNNLKKSKKKFVKKIKNQNDKIKK